MTEQPRREVKDDPPKYEEYAAPGWKNPYVIYLVTVSALFGFLVLMGYLAWTNDWIPHR